MRNPANKFEVGRMYRVRVDFNYLQSNPGQVRVGVEFLPGSDEMWERIYLREPVTLAQATTFRNNLLSGTNPAVYLEEWDWSPSAASPLGFMQRKPSEYQPLSDVHEGCGGLIIGVDPDGHGNLYHCSKCGSDKV